MALVQLRAAIAAGLPSGPDDALMRLPYEFDVLAGTYGLHIVAGNSLITV